MKIKKKSIYHFLHRYQQGLLNPEQEQIMNGWYDSIHVEGADHKNAEDIEVKKELWSAIKSGMTEEPVAPENVFTKRWWQTGIAKLAAVFFLVAVGFAIYGRLHSKMTIAGVPDKQLRELLVSSNISGNPTIVRLTDGSEVTLNPGAVLYYPNVFSGSERKVYLKGDAFFEVTPNSKKPFLVYADHIITRVVGTSFTIKKNSKAGTIEVSVITGVVNVTQNQDQPGNTAARLGVLLTPNKKVTFYPENETLVAGLVEQPRLIHKEESDNQPGMFKYTNVPLLDILPQLEKAYGVKIDVRNESMRDCNITADVSQFKDLFVQLDILCAAIGAEYQVKGDIVMLTGEGCKALK